MTWWLAWLIFVASFVLLGFVGYHFSVRALRFFALFFAVIVIGLVTRYGVTHRMGGPASFVNSFIRGFNDLSVAFFQLPFGRDVRWRTAPGTTAGRSATSSRASSPACGVSLMIPSARWSGHGTGSQLIQISASSKPARRASPIFSMTRSGETIRRSARHAPSAGAWTRSSRLPCAMCFPAGPATCRRPPPGSRTSGACGLTRGVRRPGPVAPGLPSKPLAIASGRCASHARPAGWPGWRPPSCRSSCRRSRDSPSS